MLGPTLLGAEAPPITARRAGSLVSLGSTGIKASFLAQGTGYNGYNQSSAQTRAGKEAFERLVRRALEHGINFLDMADLYGSHPFVKEVIRDIPRRRLVLLSKIWPRPAKWCTPSGGARAEVERFCRELNTDHLDICLIHCMLNEQWPAEFARIREELAALKKEGKVRAVGVSCHHFGALKVAARDPWVDVIFARVNHKGGKQYSCDAPIGELSAVLRQARGNGKAVVGMKIFGAGKLTSPEAKDASLKYVIQNRLVDAMTIGTTTPAQVDDTVARVDRALAG